LVLPILAGLIWLSVRKGLAPLNAMASTLETRPASDLSALPDADTPSEIKPVILSLNGLFGRVSAARQRERDFTAFAAHELRTPIAGLKTQAQVALGSEDPRIRNNALRQMVIGVDRTSRLVRQLTDLTNTESGEIATARQDVNLGKILRQMADDIGQHYSDTAAIEVDPELSSVCLSMDPSLFTLAARNLLENAALHSGADRVVRCTVRPEKDGIAVVVDDSGPGIPEDELPKVRDRFYRGRNKIAMGSGLGLAIADLAMSRLGGEVYLENRREGGLRAELRFSDTVKTDCSNKAPIQQRLEHP
ncbi:MAG: ATP-binding protein, partial [Pseudolabrys sp.]|nr:ATP-binding protein [Pseudolabrys sp.]